MNLVLIALVTIVVVRMLVGFQWSQHFDRLIDSRLGEWYHHFYTGILILVISMLFLRGEVRPLGVGIGAGLILDQAMLPFYLARLKGIDYWSFRGIGIVVLAFLLFAALQR